MSGRMYLDTDYPKGWSAVFGPVGTKSLSSLEKGWVDRHRPGVSRSQDSVSCKLRDVGSTRQWEYSLKFEDRRDYNRPCRTAVLSRQFRGAAAVTAETEKCLSPLPGRCLSELGHLAVATRLEPSDGVRNAVTCDHQFPDSTLPCRDARNELRFTEGPAGLQKRA